MDGTDQTNAVQVSFVEGKFGKRLPVVNSCIFPKDGDRVRFSCRTRGCKATLTFVRGEDGQTVARVNGNHNHPNHALSIKNIEHMHRLREDVKDDRNKYVITKTVKSTVRDETGMCRRKSADYRLARRIRMRGQHPGRAEDIVVTQTLANNCIFISDDRSVIVLAREWGSSFCATQNASVSTARSEVCLSYTSGCSRSTSFARTGRLFPSSTHFSKTNALHRMLKCLMRSNGTQPD